MTMGSWTFIHPFILVFFLSPLAWTAEPVFLAENTPPPGFENLSQSQQSLVDVYYGNRYLGSQLASFRPGIVELSNPADIIRLIGNLNDSSFIVSALSGELDSHPDQICPPSRTEGCGLLTPAVAGVIFDESRFRVDVFINRRFMLTRAADVLKYLPPSDAGFALLQNVSGTVSGSNAASSENSYTLNGLTMASWQENSLYWNWDYSNNNHFSVNQLYGQRDFEGLQYSAGLLSTRGFGFNLTSDQPMIGARINSSDDTREDIDFSGGMPVEVFLPVRGRVEIYKDARLIGSAFYEAGSQLLDTTSFPNGAYDLMIRILDEQGNLISEETRFFAKQNQIPPVNEWLFFAESGRVVTRESTTAFPELTEQWLTRAGVSRRLMDTLAATGSVAANHDDALVELGLYHFGYRYELVPSIMLAKEGAKGVNVNSRLFVGPVSLNAGYRRLWQKRLVTTEASNPPLLGEGFDQRSISATSSLFGGSLSYRYSYNVSENSEPARSNSLVYRRTLFRAYDYDTDIGVSLSKSGDNQVALFSLNLRYRMDQWNFRASPRAEISKSDDQTNRTERVRLSASWDDGDLYDGDLRFNGGVEVGSDNDRLDASAQYANHYGRAALSVNHSMGGSENVTSWGGSLSTSFITDGHVIAMGGENRAESALVVQLDGRDGDVFDVRVNGQRRGYAIAGSPSIISLTPFEQYRVSLSPAGETLYSFDEREKSVTLYPGNVVTLEYDAIPLQLLFGRLLLNGEPLGSARISGGLYPGSTDDLGMFQLETRSDVGQLKVELENGWICELPVEALESGYVLQMGNIDLKNTECAQALGGQLAISKRGGVEVSETQ